GRVEQLQEHGHHHPDGDDQPLSARQRMRGDVRRAGHYFLSLNSTVAVTDRPAIIGRDGLPSNAIRTGTRCVTLTQLPFAFCAGSSENWLPLPAPMLCTCAPNFCPAYPSTSTLAFCPRSLP